MNSDTISAQRPQQLILLLSSGYHQASRMSVHYKFKSAIGFDRLPVEGVNISLVDLKEAIIQQKRLGRGLPFDLQITNAETNEVYSDENTLIPKNSSLVVARVPVDRATWKKTRKNSRDSVTLLISDPANLMNTEDAVKAAEIDRKVKEHTDLTKMEGTEEDKIYAMMAQSTLDFHPSKYVKIRNSNMAGKVPKEYKCFKCHQKGHWINNCPFTLNNQVVRKCTGIPSMFLREVKDANVPGAMITAEGKFVINVMQEDMEKQLGKVQVPIIGQKPPPELICGICKELLKEAVLMPCCDTAYCDECICNHLLEHACPSCEDEGTRPEMLKPNRYLRSKCKEFDINGYVQLSTLSKSMPNSQNDSRSPPASPISTPQGGFNSPITQTPGTNSQQPHSPLAVRTESTSRPISTDCAVGNEESSKSYEENDITSNNLDMQDQHIKEERDPHKHKDKKYKKRKRELSEDSTENEERKRKRTNRSRSRSKTSRNECSGQQQYSSTPSEIPEYNPLVPPPVLYNQNTSLQYYDTQGPFSGMQHEVSYSPYQSQVPPIGIPNRNPSQHQYVEDPLAEFNKIMLKKDTEKRRIQRNKVSRSPNQRYRSHRRSLSRKRDTPDRYWSNSQWRNYNAMGGGVGHSSPSYRRGSTTGRRERSGHKLELDAGIKMIESEEEYTRYEDNIHSKYDMEDDRRMYGNEKNRYHDDHKRYESRRGHQFHWQA